MTVRQIETDPTRTHSLLKRVSKPATADHGAHMLNSKLTTETMSAANGNRTQLAMPTTDHMAYLGSIMIDQLARSKHSKGSRKLSKPLTSSPQ